MIDNGQRYTFICFTVHFLYILLLYIKCSIIRRYGDIVLIYENVFVMLGEKSVFFSAMMLMVFRRRNIDIVKRNIN